MAWTVRLLTTRWQSTVNVKLFAQRAAIAAYAHATSIGRRVAACRECGYLALCRDSAAERDPEQDGRGRGWPTHVGYSYHTGGNAHRPVASAGVGCRRRCAFGLFCHDQARHLSAARCFANYPDFRARRAADSGLRL